MKLPDTADQDGFIGEDQPYGTGEFGQAGVKAGFDLDTRGHRLDRHDGRPVPRRRQARRLGLRRGRRASMSRRLGRAVGFGGVEGRLRGYIVGRKRHARAASVGGRKVFGEYPWFEAAFVGGSKSLRGYRKNRFAGDGSLYGSVEARLWLFTG